MKESDGKVAIVTVAGSGFGKAIAELYVHEGAKVVLADINEGSVRAVADQLGEHAVACHADVSSEADIKRKVDSALEHFGTVDIIVNNAAITHPNQPLLDVDEETFDRMFDVNVKSIYYTVQDRKSTRLNSSHVAISYA